MDVIVGGSVAAAVALVVFGFATPSPRQERATDATQARSFSDDLRACRFMKGGRTAQRDRLDASDAYIAACLRRRGWAPDGAPTLESVLRD